MKPKGALPLKGNPDAVRQFGIAAAHVIALVAVSGGFAPFVACVANAQERSLDPVHERYPAPQLPLTEPKAELSPNDTLSAAIADAYATNPELESQRYVLRATDDEVGVALSQTRPRIDLQVSGRYDLTLPGDITNASRPISDQLNNPNIERDELNSQLAVEQPLFTGGRAAGALRVARAQSAAGREALRGVEGDILVNLIAAYSDVRRDGRIVEIRSRNLVWLDATLDEIAARREAGELTRTDLAQAETQLEIARVQLNAALAQFEASRASFVAIVGRAPGILAPEPDLPNLPRTAEEAFRTAEANNPDLAAAFAAQRAAEERIGLAKSEGRPILSLRGTAGTIGPALPFVPEDQDVVFTGGATLTIPLSEGGRIRSRVAQARNEESAERLRVEATRRGVIQAVVNSWNQWVTAERNLEAQELQRKAAAIFYEGSLEEYREGLRSTFDVLFAQNSLNEAEIDLLASRRESYVARAALLRQIGMLEADRLLTNSPAYDPDAYLDRVEQRNAVPWGPVVRALDGLTAPIGKPQKLTEIESAAQSARIEVGPPAPVPDELVSSPSPQPAITVPDTVDIEGGLR